MNVWDEERLRLATSHFVPVELQRRGLQSEPIFSEVAQRAFHPIPDGLQLVQPWYGWRGISTYQDCVAYADRAARELPTGRSLNLTHVTPGQFYSASIIFFAQALIDNIADWLSDAVPLQTRGGERNFRKGSFKRELKRRLPGADEVLVRQHLFVEEINARRQVWIHTLAGGALPVADGNPFDDPDTAEKRLGVPIDPGINPDEENYLRRVEACANANGGRYLYDLAEFTDKVFSGAKSFYSDWLRTALHGIPK
jgi:hypothetical protein